LSKTGILTAKKDWNEVKLFFVDGNVVRVEPDASKHRMFLGEMLISAGKITRETLAMALKEQENQGKFLGEILLSHKWVTKEDIQKVIQTQIYEVIYELFQWEEGLFEFETRKRSENLKILPSLSPDQMLLNVSWMVDEWQEIEKTIPTLNVIFEKVKRPDEEFLDDETQKRGLTFNQKIIYDLVDGKRTAKDIIENGMMGRFDTCNILSELLEQGYIKKYSVKKIPIYQKVELRSSRFVFRLFSVLLIVSTVYFGVRYVFRMKGFFYRHKAEIALVVQAQMKNVATPELYEKALEYKLLTKKAAHSASDLWAENLLSSEELKILSIKDVNVLLNQWKGNYPF
jgi:hypothetical protein